MVCMEQGLTIGEAGISRQLQIDQITDCACSCAAHRLWNGCQLAQVVIDDGLTGYGEDIAVGGKRDRDAAITGGHILIFGPFRHFIQLRETIQANTFSFMEVGQRTALCPLLECFTAILPAGQY